MAVLAMAAVCLQAQPTPPEPLPAQDATANPVAKKLKGIVIPNFTLQDTELTKVIEFLAQGSVIYDATGVEPKGVKIIPVFDPSVDNPRINANFQGLTLERLLGVITEQAGFEFKVTGDAVLISKAKPAVAPPQPATPTTGDPPAAGATIAKPIPTIDPATVGKVKWAFATSSTVYSSPALGADGTVYVGSVDGKLHAVNDTTGKTVWEFKTGGQIDSTPAIAPDGTVYIGSFDKKVYALDGRTGTRIWEFVTGGQVGSSPAIGGDGTVYIGSTDKKVYALNGKTGEKTWEFLTAGKVYCSPAVGEDGTVFIGSDDGKVYALNGKTGQKAWEFKTGGSIGSSTTLGANGTVYVGSDDKKVYALNGESGDKIWEFLTLDEVHSIPAIGGDGIVYVGCGKNFPKKIKEGRLYALNGESGEKIWEFNAGEGMFWSSPAVGEDGTVYVGSGDGKLYAVNGRTGGKTWEFATSGIVFSSPVISPDGTIYVGSNDKNLYAIQGSSGPALDSPWPMRGNNARHTGRAGDRQNPPVMPETATPPPAPLPLVDYEWEEVASLETGKIFHDGVEVIDGKIYMIGGWYEYPKAPSTELLRFDPATKQIEKLPPVPGVGRNGPGTAVLDGKLYVIDANNTGNVQVFDPKTNQWSTGPPLPYPFGLAAALTVNGKILVFGGDKNVLVAAAALNTVLELDPATQKWTQKKPMTTPRVTTRVILHDGKVWVIGGSQKEKPLDTVEIYDVEKDTWTTGPKLDTARDSPLAWVAQGRLYVAGGGKFWGVMKDSILVYDPASNAWKDAGKLPVPVFGTNAAVVGDKVYAVSGMTNNKKLSNKIHAASLVPKIKPSAPPALTIDPASVGKQKWAFQAGGPVESSPAIGADGTVYVGSHDKKVYAMDGRTGAKVWEFETGDKVRSSPTLGADGTIYVGSSDNNLYALDGKTGAKIWEFVAGNRGLSSPAIGTDGTVYVGSDDNKLYALNGQTGVKLWEFETGGSLRKSPAIGADGTVYVGSSDGNLYALDGKTGAKVWEFLVGTHVQSSPAIGPDGTVYMGRQTRRTASYMVCALDGKTGAKVWEFVTGGAVWSSPAVGPDGTVYVGTYDNNLYALDGKTGAKVWEFVAGDKVRSSPAIGADGTVYVGSWDGKVYAVDGKTGAKAWEFVTGSDVYSSPAIGPDGTVYVGSFDKKVYAIQGSSGPAQTGWPMFGQNAQHTGRAGDNQNPPVVPAPPKPPGTKLWEFQTGGAIHSAPAIGPDGTVYIGSKSWKMYALDGRTGKEIWNFKTDQGILGAPAISTDGLVYFGSNDNNLYALQAGTGAKVWAFKTDGGIYSSPAIGADGTVYFGSDDSHVYALDGKTGQPRWKSLSFSKRVAGSPAIGLDGTVYISSHDGKLRALDGRNGTVLWTGESTGYGSPAISADGTIHQQHAYNGGTGRKLWKGMKVGTRSAIGPDGTIYTQSQKNSLLALHPLTGTTKWEFPGDTVIGAPAIAADHTIYFGTVKGVLHAVDSRNGTRLWEFNCGVKIQSSPVIAEDGTVYFGSYDGKLYAIQGSTGPATDAPWPMFGQNARLTARAGDRQNAAAGPPSFTAHVITDTAPGAHYVHAADMDNDGDMDALSASFGDGTAAWYENDGTGKAYKKHELIKGEGWIKGVHATDMDGDGDMDVLAASENKNSVYLFRNNGGKAFATEIIDNGTAKGARYARAADLDSDGDKDVVVAASPHAWYKNEGDGKFKKITFSAGSTAHLHVVDLDGDGGQDGIYGKKWVKNNDNGFGSILNLGWGTTSVHAADMDGDGDMDGVSAEGGAGTIAWHENDGEQNFTTHVITKEETGAHAVHTADMDGDGDMDVLSASIGKGVAWHENDGKQNFTLHRVSSDGQAMSVFAADMDGDGHLDILTAMRDKGQVVWYENDSTGPPPPLELQWEEVAPVSVPRLVFDGVEVLDGKIYCVGGANDRTKETYDLVERYDPATNQWEKLAPMSVPRSGVATTIHEGKLYAIGGQGLRSMEILDPKTGQWTPGPELPAAIFSQKNADDLTQAISLGGKILLLAGRDRTRKINPLYELDPRTNQWKEKTPLPAPIRSGFIMIPYEGKAWVLSGADWGGTGEFYTQVHIYDPGKDTWSIGPGLNKKREFPCVWVGNGRIYVAGGKDSGLSYLDSMEAYDPVTRQWSNLAGRIPETKWAAGTAVVNNKVYLIAGHIKGGSGPDSLYSSRVFAANLATTPKPFVPPPDPNPAPTDILLAAGPVTENEPAGTTVGTLTLVDPGNAVAAAPPKPAPNIDPAKVGTKLWEFQTQSEGQFHTSPSLSPEGILYFSGGKERKLYAVDAVTGQEVWTHTGKNGGFSKPSIDADGRIYLAGGNKIHAFDGRTGATIWEFQMGSDAYPFPTLDGKGRLYLGSNDRKFYAINTGDGSKAWEFRTGGEIHMDSALSTDGIVYFASEDGHVYALNSADGSEIWKTRTGGRARCCVALGSDGTVYVGSEPNNVYAMNGKTGEIKWNFKTTGEINPGLALGADNTVYVVARGKWIRVAGQPNDRSPGKTYALDGATGESKWEFPNGGSSVPALGSDGTVYFGSWDGNFYALDAATGAKKWAFETGARIEMSSTLIGPTGIVYIGSTDGRMYAFQGSSGPATDSPWPMRGQNARRTARAGDRQNPAAGPATFTASVISDEVKSGDTVHAIDMDRDGDMDVLCSSYGGGTVGWYENDGSLNFTRHVIVQSHLAYGTHAADMDGDGDIDVVSLEATRNEIYWHENDGKQNFTKHLLDQGIQMPRGIHAADVDGDGDIDVLAAIEKDNTLAWYENDGAQKFTKRAIDDKAMGVKWVETTDMDGDGRIDVLCASMGDNTIAWYSLGAGTRNFTKHIVTDKGAAQLKSAHAVDLDGDGDMDVASAAQSGTVAWHENDGAGKFTDHILSNAHPKAHSVYTADMDGDGDVDVVAGSMGPPDKVRPNGVAWFENDGNQQFTMHSIANLPAFGVHLADMDRDGLPDILAAGVNLSWFRNNHIRPASFELAAGEGDTDNAFFAIEQQTLKLAAPLDFEKKPRYSLRVRGTDPGGKFIEKPFLVEVTDVLEESRFAVALDGRDDVIAVDRRDGRTLIHHADLTLMSWFKVTADTVQPPSILSIPRNPGEAVDGGTPGVLNLAPGLGGPNIPGLRIATGDNEVVDVVSGQPVPQGAWTHIAVTIKSGGAARLYINGKPDTAVDLAGRTISWGNALNPLYVGSTAIARGYLPGLLDDVRIYSRELTPAEIQEVFLSPRGTHGSGPLDESLQLHLALEEGAGDKSADISKHQRNAILLNGVAWTRDTPGFPFIPVKRQNLGAFIIVSIEGQVQVQGLDGKPLPAVQVAPGKLLLQGQTVHTGPKGAITLLLSNGSTITLKAMTGVVLDKLEQKQFVLPASTKLSDLEAEPSTSRTELKLGYGDLIFNVKKLNKGSHFQIESPVGMAAIRGTSGQLSVRIDPATKVATGAVNMATGTVEFQDKEDEVVDVPAGKAVQVQATAEGEKIGEIQEYVAPPVIIEQIKIEVQEIEVVTEQIVVQFVAQAVEQTKEKVAEFYGIEFREYTDPGNRVIKAHIWKLQGGLVFLELENGRLIKTPLTNFSPQSQQVLKTIRTVIPTVIPATTPVTPQRQ